MIIRDVLRAMLVCVVASSLSLTGCEKKEAARAGAEEPAPSTEAAVVYVEVPAQGKEFDPPIKPEQIPPGAFYCDMGTVEYARLEKGDNKCPVCGMLLKQKPGGAASAKQEEPAKDGHEGHDHHGHEGHKH
jgi:hypothetical protein